MTAATIQGTITTSTDVANGATKTVDLPADAVVGELVVVVVGGASWGDSALAGATIRKAGIFPEGWAVYGTPTADATSAGLVAVREVDGTEDWFGDASPTIDIGPMTDTDDASAHIAFRALAGSWKVTAATGTGTAPDSPEATVNEVETGLAVTLFGGGDDVGISAYPYAGNQTTETATDTAEDAVAALSTATFDGDENPGAWTADASVGWVAFTLLLFDIVDADVQGATVQVGVGFGETWAETPYVWTDLTKRVRGVEPYRGRQYELDQITAGTMTVLFNNRDGALNSHNSLSPYAGDLRPTVPIRLRAFYDGAWHPIWQGYVERWPVSFPGGLDSVVAVQAVDLFKLLSLAETADATREAVVDNLAPVAWWRFDQDGATQDDHSSTADHDATLIGAPTDETAGAWPADKAVTFNGTDEYATIANETDVELRADTTIEGWVRPHTATGTVSQIISCSGGASPSAMLFSVGWRRDQEQFTFGPVQSDGTTLVETVTPADQWHHIAVTFDWGATQRVVKAYVNGDLIKTATYNHLPDARTRAVNIARIDTVSGDYFDGDISELAVFDKVLTAAEVATLYNAQRDTFPEAQSGARAEALLDAFGYLPRVIDTGQSLMALRDPGQSSYLDELGVTAETENGVFFIDRAGRAAFHDRDHRSFETVSSGTFGPSDLTIFDVTLGLDDELVFNDFRVRPDETTDPFIARDEDSIDRHGRRTFERTVYVANPLEALDAAHWLRAGFSEAPTRIGRLTLLLGKDTALWPVVLALDIGTRVTISKTTTGDDYSDDHYIESISHRISAMKTWEVTLQLSPASQFVQFILGDDVLGILGGPGRLGY